jgi:uncharacterized membrane protein YbhN (UPF0104 family)
MESNTKLTKLKAYLVPLIIMIVIGIVLFLPAGTLRFWEAWIYWLEITIVTFFITAYFLKRSPELLSRRLKYKENDTTKKPPGILNLFFVGYFIPGIDFRFHWSNVPIWIVIASNAICVIISIAVAMVVYGVLVILLKTVDEQELLEMPKGATILRISRKFHMM